MGIKENRLIGTFSPDAAPASGAEVTGSIMNELQDRTVIMKPLTEEEDGLAALDPPNGNGWVGATWYYYEGSHGASSDLVIDSVRDWRNRETLMIVQRVGAANEVPSAANHAPGRVLDGGILIWNTKSGVTLGGGFGAGTASWKPCAGADLYIYARDTNGNLIISNTNVGVTYHVYATILMTEPINA